MRVLPILLLPLALLSYPLPASESHAQKPEEPQSHESAGAEAGAGKKHGAKEAENTPQLRAKPDSAFIKAVDWNDGSVEVLAYAVKRNGKGGESECKGRLTTGRLFLHPDGRAEAAATGKGDVEILNARLAAEGKESGVPFSFETTVKLRRDGAFTMLRQDQSLQSWPGSTQRSLDCRVAPPRMRVLSSGGEAGLDSVLTRWPVYTEEMLFTYVRAVPQRAGYLEEIWFQDWGREGRLAVLPQFATLSVHTKTSAVREVDTWHMTLDRDDGRRSEFWVSAKGLHPVVLAILADGSTWTLESIARRNPPAP